ncbi:carbon-nitrogen hydrolase family protein [Aliikangiella maris]|uniref:Carbon-nitrogen hydrolase family protein n=2 Tax=Aliikangiella maris TaxID=3162458 RepID=A0ABV3MMU2_9GAMM
MQVLTNPQLTVAAVQMTSGVEIDENLATAATLIKQAALQGAQIVVLPEYFAIMGYSETTKILLTETHGKGKVQVFLAEQAKQHSVWLIGGSHSADSGVKGRPYGRCYIFSPQGQCISWYDKIHLFDVNVADNTGQYRESKSCSPGIAPVVFETPWGKMGVAICYDIRFPELFRQLTVQGAKVIFVPAAFTRKTGEAHWEILLRARAIESQVFIIASAQTGEHENGRQTWGHSCVISPDGKMLSVLKSDVGVVLAELDLQMQNKYRNEFPVLDHTRL